LWNRLDYDWNVPTMDTTDARLVRLYVL
jgi:hypothetical protein